MFLAVSAHESLDQAFSEIGLSILRHFLSAEHV